VAALAEAGQEAFSSATGVVAIGWSTARSTHREEFLVMKVGPNGEI